LNALRIPRIELAQLAAGYTVPRVIHGAWQLSAGHREGGIAARDAVAGLARLAEAGFDTFDCADIYTGVEELLGEVVRAAPVPVRVQ
jgi:aryl-alcohol dehydrogenase-like predicted oxidoreductase